MTCWFPFPGGNTSEMLVFISIGRILLCSVPWIVSHSSILVIGVVSGVLEWVAIFKSHVSTAVLKQESLLHTPPIWLPANSRKVLCGGMKTKQASINLSLALDPQKEQTQVLASCQHLQIPQSRILHQEFYLLSFQLVVGAEVQCVLACCLHISSFQHPDCWETEVQGSDQPSWEPDRRLQKLDWHPEQPKVHARPRSKVKPLALQGSQLIQMLSKCSLKEIDLSHEILSC